MMGKNHVIGGAGLASILATGAVWATGADTHVIPSSIPYSSEINNHIHNISVFIVDQFWKTNDSLAHMIVFSIVAVIVFIIGTLLPDCDKPKSTIGKYLYLPFTHRGITHTDWVLIVLGTLAWLDPLRILAWLWLGVLTHLLLDELSFAGRVHFYPLTSYKIWQPPGHSDPVVVKPHWVGLYATGSPAEYILATVITALGMWLPYHVFF